MTTQRLTTEDESAVRDAIGALEIADGAVPPEVFSALKDPALRKVVAQRLEDCGRTLINIDVGWTTGYRDDVADALIKLGIGTLTTEDRAVLALALLRTVAIPRARGSSTGATWGTLEGIKATTIDELAQSRHLSKKEISRSVRHLRALGVLRTSSRGGIVPGPALQRLTPQRATWLWEDLLILAAPDSAYAQVLRARRSQLHRIKEDV